MAGPDYRPEALAAPSLFGCDFSSAPSRRKAIVLAIGSRRGSAVSLSALHQLDSLAAFGAWLAGAGNWLGAFDFPFGLPRELVQALGWPLQWEPCIRYYAGLSRAEIRDRFAAFCQARPTGGKFAHRATDLPAGSSPSMKWINPPVAYMLHAGVPLLLAAGARIPGMHGATGAQTRRRQAADRVALEAYPGLLARELIGRESYKSDAPMRQNSARALARGRILQALETGRTRLGLSLELTPAQHAQLLGDGSGDTLDAVLCLVQAAWAEQRHAQGDAGYGLPEGFDPLEGWIITASAGDRHPKTIEALGAATPRA